jgi:hypothetical protein
MNSILLKKRQELKRQREQQQREDIIKLEEEKECNIDAKYGRGKKYVDVTEIVKNKFIKDGIVLIPKEIVLSEIFRNPLKGTKKLIIKTSNNEHILLETRPYDFRVNI